LLYGLTIFVGAFLLFLVQPMIAKYLLPWFGGGPGVWTVCLLFFQAVLLAGYAYAHWLTSRLRPRAQAIVHIALLLLSLAFLPIVPRAPWQPLAASAPTWRLLGLLAATVGLPYLVLAATGPLLQRWWTQESGAAVPFRLYALSNAGSLLALLAYPFVVEPLWSRPTQAWIWSWGMAAFALMCAVCAWRAAKEAPVHSRVTEAAAALPVHIAPAHVLGWLAFPAVGSLLLAGVTNQLTTDLGSVPFLWVLPLAIYLLSFILCFDHPRWYSRKLFGALLAIGCGGVIYTFFFRSTVNLFTQLVVYLPVLFAACMVCHGEVHRLKPAPAKLTTFYLCLAAGGAAGTFFVVVIAPLLYSDYYEIQAGLCLLLVLIGILSFAQRSGELPVGLAAGIVLGLFLVPALAAANAAPTNGWAVYWAALKASARYGGWLAAPGLLLCVLSGSTPSRGPEKAPKARELPAFVLIAAVALAIGFVRISRETHNVVLAVRNFYGAFRVLDRDPDHSFARRWELSHGSTEHGSQFQSASRADWPTTYYGASSGVGFALDTLKPGASRRIGVVGLGAGTLASYGRAGDRFTFYEINPAIVSIARAPFTFLKSSAAQIKIMPGDARLELEDQARRGDFQHFDVLVLDAFTSDSIPTHLLTVEAVQIYLHHLKPDGILAVHTSNRFLDLRGVAAGLARRFQMDCLILEDKPNPDKFWLNPSEWCLLTRDPQLLSRWLPASPELKRALEQSYHPVLWTDDHASLLSVLRRS
jgi:hypothetical protein